MVCIYLCGAGGSGKSLLVQEILRTTKVKNTHCRILGIPRRTLKEFQVTDRQQLNDPKLFYCLQEKIIKEQCKQEDRYSNKGIISDHCIIDSLVHAKFKLEQKHADNVDTLLNNEKVQQSIARYKSSLVILVGPLPSSMVQPDGVRMEISEKDRESLHYEYKCFLHEQKIPFLDLHVTDTNERLRIVRNALGGTIHLSTSTLSYYDQKNKNREHFHINNFPFYKYCGYNGYKVRTISLTEHEMVQSWTTWDKGKCNRFIEKYDTGKLLILAFDASLKSSTVQRILLDKIHINGKLYSFLGCDSSGLKNRKCYMWHGSEDEVEAIIQENGQFDNQSVSKRMARIGLLFSEVQLTSISITEDKVIEKGDIFSKENKCFTDGCGGIGLKLAKKILHEIKSQNDDDNYIPAVYQIRYQGFKGVLALDPRLEDNAIMVRPSMRKFETSIHDRIGICGFSQPHTFGHLNRQFIQVLSALGIPDDVFIEKQRQFLDMIMAMGKESTSTSTILQWLNKFDMAHFCIQEATGMEDEIRKIQVKLVNKTVGKIKREKKEQTQEDQVHQSTLKKQNTKLSILVPDSRNIYGVCDQTETLKYGECFLRITTGNIGSPKTLTGKVVVCKSPCYLLGDVRVLKAVDDRRVDNLKHLVDCIVFPVCGKRPHPDEMSGSDLDGDMFFVSWDPDLIPPEMEEPYNYPDAKAKTQGEITLPKTIRHFAFLNHTEKIKRRIGSFYNRWADKMGIASAKCQRLGQLFSQAVDSVKSGCKIKIPDDLYPSNVVGQPHSARESNQLVTDESLSSAVQSGMNFVWQKMEKSASDFKNGFNEGIICSGSCLQEVDDQFVHNILQEKISNVSEYQKFQFVMRYIQTKANHDEDSISPFLENFADFIDFDMFTLTEKRDAIRTGIPSKLFANALHKSQLLLSEEISHLRLHSGKIPWKFYFRSGHDNLKWVHVLRALTQCDRSLIVMQMPDEITFILQFSASCAIGEDIEVVPGTVISFFISKRFGHTRKYILGSEYRFTLTEKLFQLYRQNKTNTFIWLKADNDDYSINGSSSMDHFYPTSIDLTRFIGNTTHPRINKTPFERIEVFVHSDESSPYFDSVVANELNLEENLADMEDKVYEYEASIHAPSFPNREYNPDITLESENNFRDALQKSVNDVDPVLYTNILQTWLQKNDVPDVLVEMTVSLLERLVAYVMPLEHDLSEDIATALKHILLANVFIDSLDLLKTVAHLSRLGLADFAVELFSNAMEKISLEPLEYFDLLSQWHIWFSFEKSTAEQMVINLESVALEKNKLLKEKLSYEERKLKYLMQLAKSRFNEFLQSVEPNGEKNQRKALSINGLKVSRTKDKTDNCLLFYLADTFPRYKGYRRGSLVFISRHRKTKDSQQHLSFCCLARINSIHLDPLTVKVKILEKIPDILIQCSESDSADCWSLKLVGTSLTFERQVMSLKRAVGVDISLLNLLIDPIARQTYCMKADDSMLHTEKGEVSERQILAVERSLNQPLTLIEGYPGTGKTTTACKIIIELKARVKDGKILIVAKSDMAVDNIVKMLKYELPLDILRIGAAERVDKEIYEFTLEGQMKRMEEMGTVEDKQKHEMKREVLEGASIILTTSNVVTDPILKNCEFECVLFEEASQINEVLLICSLVHGAKKVILIGEHKPCTTFEFRHLETPCIAGDLDSGSTTIISPFQQLCEILYKDVISLDTQCRMHRTLMNFPSDTFYDGKVISNTDVKPVIFPWPEKERPLCFIDVEGSESRKELSYYNRDEIDAVQIVLNRLLNIPDREFVNQFELRLDLDDIGVLAPYQGQVIEMKTKIQQKVEIKTVDAFTGREKDVIIVSTVRANKTKSLGFLDCPDRMNILLTRAKRGLVVVGNKNTLQSELWNKWLEHVPKATLQSLHLQTNNNSSVGGSTCRNVQEKCSTGSVMSGKYGKSRQNKRSDGYGDSYRNNPTTLTAEVLPGRDEENEIDDVGSGRGHEGFGRGGGRGRGNGMCGRESGRYVEVSGRGRGAENEMFGRGSGRYGEVSGRGRGAGNEMFGRGSGRYGEVSGRGRGAGNEMFGRGNGRYGEVSGRGRGPGNEMFGRGSGRYGEVPGRERGAGNEMFGRGSGRYDEVSGRERGAGNEMPSRDRGRAVYNRSGRNESHSGGRQYGSNRGSRDYRKAPQD